jgi:hypothetical protein
MCLSLELNALPLEYSALGQRAHRAPTGKRLGANRLGLKDPPSGNRVRRIRLSLIATYHRAEYGPGLRRRRARVRFAPSTTVDSARLMKTTRRVVSRLSGLLIREPLPALRTWHPWPPQGAGGLGFSGTLEAQAETGRTKRRQLKPRPSTAHPRK